MLNISCHSLLACQVFVEKRLGTLMDFPLQAKDLFCLAAFLVFVVVVVVSYLYILQIKLQYVLVLACFC